VPVNADSHAAIRPAAAAAAGTDAVSVHLQWFKDRPRDSSLRLCSWLRIPPNRVNLGYLTTAYLIFINALSGACGEL